MSKKSKAKKNWICTVLIKFVDWFVDFPVDLWIISRFSADLIVNFYSLSRQIVDDVN